MKGVKFGSHHSYTEWGLILSEKDIQAPKIKTMEVDIAGGNGTLDYTEYFGDVKYENRSLSFGFSKMNIVPDEFLVLFSEVQNALHGQKMKIVLDDDQEHYYYGRVAVNDWKSNKSVGEIVIDVDAEPYKYIDVEVVQVVSGTQNIVLTSGRMPVVPEITTTAAMTIVFDGFTATVNAGTFRLPELQLKEGQNTLTVTGEGSITFRYRQGSL